MTRAIWFCGLILLAACSGGSDSGIPSFVDVAGMWTGSATFTNNCANPACEWQGTLSPPSVIIELTQTQNILDGEVTVALPTGTPLIPGSTCNALAGTVDVQPSQSSIEGTQVTLTNMPEFLFVQTWHLQVTSDTMQGTLESEAPGCTGIQTSNVSLSRQ